MDSNYKDKIPEPIMTPAQIKKKKEKEFLKLVSGIVGIADSEDKSLTEETRVEMRKSLMKLAEAYTQNLDQARLGGMQIAIMGLKGIVLQIANDNTKTSDQKLQEIKTYFTKKVGTMIDNG